MLGEQYANLKDKIFGKSSEKSPKDKKKGKGNKNTGKRVQLPSKRYPNLPVIEKEEDLKGELPSCPCCNEDMVDSGMWETSETLTVIPKQYRITRLKKKKYRCKKCYGGLVTTPAPPRITPGGSYSDEMILDVALSKYCDLIPIERYAQMAARQGVMDLPPQSLIGITHHLANFVESAALKCREEVRESDINYADETPHKMLEDNDDKKSWYLWGFSTLTACFFNIQGTRSGDVASDFLKDSKCQYLMTDVFSGYKKAVRETNEYRREKKLAQIIKLYCNAHARRYFKGAAKKYSEAEYFVKKYRQIYRWEDIVKKVPPDKKVKARRLMMNRFKLMEKKVIEIRNNYSSKSSIGQAMRYFFDNYKELTFFTTNPRLPADNNHLERLLRAPVVGRKTWYGTHSKRGAKTAAILFTLVESCKLNKINPRKYFKELVEDLHKGKDHYTPYELKTRSQA